MKKTHRVKLNLGYTRNMGDYESMRIDVGLEVDGEGHPDATYAKVYEWVTLRFAELLESSGGE